MLEPESGSWQLTPIITAVIGVISASLMRGVWHWIDENWFTSGNKDEKKQRKVLESRRNGLDLWVLEDIDRLQRRIELLEKRIAQKDEELLVMERDRNRGWDLARWWCSTAWEEFRLRGGNADDLPNLEEPLGMKAERFKTKDRER